MASRAFIINADKDPIQGIYLHHEGSLNFAGVTLYNNYKNRAKVNELIALGDLSVLRDNIGTKTQYRNPAPNQCVAYHRDAEEDLEISKFTDMAEVEELSKMYSYVYIWKNKQWQYLVRKDDKRIEMTPLKDILIAKELLPNEAPTS